MKQIACLGDSNTYGYDSRSLLDNRFPPEIRWTDRLAAATGSRVFNFGHNGLRVAQDGFHAELARELASVQPLAMATVMLGTNDVANGRNAAEAAAHMEKLLRRLLREAPAEKILLISPVPLCPGAWVAGPREIAESEALAGRFRALAARLGTRFADAGEWGVPLCFDGIHISEEGHRIFAERMADLIE
jgi:lysophospholipase L1-like esterase